ncbi:MAG: SusC/RagA family TonB-linked outer membrane protein [Ferruginibacter sp.]|nr:SusC/RagA family TonB-linked outer membrane protein [Cytophagales bacterium]
MKKALSTFTRMRPVLWLTATAFFLVSLSDAPGQTGPQEELVVTGAIRDQLGPLPGASVSVKNTARGTIADAEGRFRLDANRNETLVFTMIGYQTKEQTVDGTAMNILLETDAKSLSEVVVVGYGASKKSDITGSVTSVKSSEFNAGVNNAPDQLLQGKVAGLNITRSGDPNAVPAVILRGPSTLRSGAAQEPFYVIDGVPGASIQLIAPNDIASIDVLKDASSTAIYGSRAANGVIIVTTRRAKAGEPVVSYNGYAAVENVSNRIEMLSAEELRAYLAANNRVLNPRDDDGDSHDWQKEVSRTGVSHNHNLSLSANTGKTSYDASVNYLNNEGVIKGSSLDRLILRGRFGQQVFNDRLKLTLSISHSTTNQKVPLEAVLGNMLTFLPTYNVKDTNGVYRENFLNGVANPISLIDNNLDDRKTRTFLANGNVELTLLPGLKYTLSLSSQDEQITRNVYFGRQSSAAQNAGGVATRSAYANTRQVLETFFNYDKVLNQHTFNLLAGYSWQQDRTGEGFQTSNRGFSSDDLTYNNLGLASPPAGYRPDYGSTTIGTLRLISFYGRVNYAFNDKYLFQASLREDGSSAFGSNNRWGLFPAFSAGWRISQENFLQSAGFLDDLKVRVGYGVTGNSLGFNPLISQIRYGSSGFFYYNGNLINAIGPTQNENPDLKWERTAMANVGLDFSVWRGRLSGSVDYYDKKTSDLIWDYPVSTTQYFVNTLTANVGEMSNRGIELQLDGVPVRTDRFSWRTSVNLAHNTNRIVSLSSDKFSLRQIPTAVLGGQGQSGNTSQIVREGLALGSFNLWRYLGKNENGVSQFLKADGTTTTSPSSLDFAYAGNAQPKLLYGWNNNFTYGNFDLNFFFRGVYGNQILNATRAGLNSPSTVLQRNIPQYTLTESVNDNNAFYISDRYLESGSYLRLDNATLGYTLPSLKGLKTLRVYVTGTNLVLLTNYEGIDPEINLGGITPGIDNRNYYPKTRSFLLGVNASF